MAGEAITVEQKVLRALLADRMRRTTDLDETGQKHFAALAAELSAKINAATEEKKSEKSK